jgi:putative ABC transport system permease protein
MSVFSRFRNALWPGRLDRDFDEELEFHHQMRLRKAREQGLSPAEAELETKRRVGNLLSTKDAMRDARVIGWLASCLQDLRHGVVLLRRDAGISALIMLVLALGIGGNAAIFTLLKAAFFDPLPYHDAGRLVTIMENSGWTPSVAEFLEIRARSRTIDPIAFAEHRDMQLSGAGEPVRVFAARVTTSFFPVLGVSPALGRAFLDEDNQPNRTPTVILTDAFWRSKMEANSNVVGRTLRLDGATAQVIGVLPPNFHFDYPTLRIAEPVDIYVSYPLESIVPLHPSADGRGIPVRVIARLRSGVTFAQAEAELRGIGDILGKQYAAKAPANRKPPHPFTFDTLPLRDAIVGTQRSLLWMLLGGAGVLLLIACANTAQLLLARSLRRGREVAIRSALGAGRLRLIRQFLLEGLVLALCGGVAGLLAAGWIAHLLIAVLPVRSPLLQSAHVDMRVVGFALALSMISALLFAILPAVKGSRWTPGPSLTARLTTGEGNRWRHALIALEAALSVFLLCGAGLVAQNLWTLISTPIGIDPNHVLVMQLKLPSAQPMDSIDHTAGSTFQMYLDKIAAIPGVDSAASVSGPPLHPTRGGPIEIVGEKDAAGALKLVMALSNQVSPDYFRTLRIPLLAGRAFRRDDTGPRVKVAIVNEEAARRFGLGRNIVGKQIDDPDGPITIVGMSANVRTNGLNTAPFPEVYISSLQLSWVNVYLVVRSAIPPAQLVKAVKSAIQSSNSDQAVFGVKTMDEWLADSVTEPRFNMFLIGAFALLAMAMAAAGMYSVISCLVTQRTSEIAIRMALGASRGAIIRIILGATLAWVVAGLTSGLGLGLAARNTIRSLSSTAIDGSPWMYSSVVLFFFLVTLLAAYLPVRRASRLDPAVALRCE